MESTPAMFAHRIEPEDQARADFYALLARLYQNAPDAALLEAIASAEIINDEAATGDGAELARTWRALSAASAAIDASAAATEYQELFVGVGRSELSLHATAYAKPGAGNPLVKVRAALAELGLARQASAIAYEDHLGALCETMRLLISVPDGEKAYPFDAQRKFFVDHLQPWVFDCCNAIRNCPIASYYRRVAEFTEIFMAIERGSFAIE